jgi:hypothetical protein
MSNPKRPNITCPVCLVTRHPCRTGQVYCSRRCGAIDRVRRNKPAFAAARAKGQVTRHRNYAQRLAARLQGLTKGAIWRLAYARGYSTAWHRARRMTTRELTRLSA